MTCTGAGSITVVTSLTAETLVVLLAFLTERLQLFLGGKGTVAVVVEQNCVTVLLVVFEVVKESRDEEGTAASMATAQPGSVHSDEPAVNNK